MIHSDFSTLSEIPRSTAPGGFFSYFHAGFAPPHRVRRPKGPNGCTQSLRRFDMQASARHFSPLLHPRQSKALCHCGLEDVFQIHPDSVVAYHEFDGSLLYSERKIDPFCFAVFRDVIEGFPVMRERNGRSCRWGCSGGKESFHFSGYRPQTRYAGRDKA